MECDRLYPSEPTEAWIRERLPRWEVFLIWDPPGWQADPDRSNRNDEMVRDAGGLLVTARAMGQRCPGEMVSGQGRRSIDTHAWRSRALFVKKMQSHSRRICVKYKSYRHEPCCGPDLSRGSDRSHLRHGVVKALFSEIRLILTIFDPPSSHSLCSLPLAPV